MSDRLIGISAARLGDLLQRNGAPYKNPQEGIVLYLSREQFTPDRWPENQSSQPIFVGFRQYQPFNVIQRLANLRQDVLMADPRLMEAIYNINASYFRAVTRNPGRHQPISAFMTFSPLQSTYFHPGQRGHYATGVTSLRHYFNMLLFFPDNSTITKQRSHLLQLCLLFNFCSFCAIHYRTRLQMDIRDFRATVTSEIRLRIRAQKAKGECLQMSHAMLAIAMTVMPAPLQPPEFDQRIQQRRCNMMSAPADENICNETY